VDPAFLKARLDERPPFITQIDKIKQRHDVRNAHDPSIRILSPDNDATIYKDKVYIVFATNRDNQIGPPSTSSFHIHWSINGGASTMHYSTNPIKISKTPNINEYDISLELVEYDHEPITDDSITITFADKPESETELFEKSDKEVGLRMSNNGEVQIRLSNSFAISYPDATVITVNFTLDGSNSQYDVGTPISVVNNGTTFDSAYFYGQGANTEIPQHTHAIIYNTLAQAFGQDHKPVSVSTEWINLTTNGNSLSNVIDVGKITLRQGEGEAAQQISVPAENVWP